MSWISEKWQQDDSLNHGFPFPADAGISPQVDVSAIKTPWAFRPDINNGFPYINELFNQLFVWIAPITDRTYSDIKNANKNSNRKKQNHEIDFEFTKAYLNYTDLNRIENNTQYLSSELSVNVTAKINWSADKIPFISDRTRILQNMNDILTKFKEKYPEIEISEVPGKLSTYSDFNQLEIVQLKIYETISERSE